MKLEDLKSTAITAALVSPVFHMRFSGALVIKIYWSDTHGGHEFDNGQTALLAAARFRASEEMYQALAEIVEMIEQNNELNRKLYPEAMSGEPLWALKAREALALADNTNDTL